jgi:HAMP domain-containing protein
VTTIIPRRSIQVGLLPKLIGATLVAGLAPLLLLSFSAIRGYRTASNNVSATTTDVLDQKSLEALQSHTREAAQSLSRFLDERTGDTLTARLLPRTPDAYLSFYQSHQGEIWYPTGAGDTAGEAREQLPLYREMTYIDATGHERLRVQDGQVVPAGALRDVSDPHNTTYKSETYFEQARALPAGQVYVSHVTGWHMSQPLQPAANTGQPTEGDKFPSYEAVVRLATPVFTESGAFDGVVMLSRDQRHVIDRAIHISPSTGGSAVYPDYASGNYAYVVDDQGYPIVHPLLARIRGLDANGALMPVAPDGTKREDLQKYNWNLGQAGWFDPNIPKLYDQVRAGNSGFIVTVNQSGARRASTYVPVPLLRGINGTSPYFAFLIIGANVDDFHKPAEQVRGTLDSQRHELQRNTLLISVTGVLMLIVTATALAVSVTRPVRRLTDAAHTMEQGELDTATLGRILDRRVHDEVTRLAAVFKRMAEQVQQRERKLREKVVELKIEIDQQKKSADVAAITESDYFQNLQAKVHTLRNRPRPRTDTNGTNATNGAGETTSTNGAGHAAHGNGTKPAIDGLVNGTSATTETDGVNGPTGA